MNIVIDGTGHDDPIGIQNKLDSVPRVGETILVYNQLYEVVHVIYDYDRDEVVLEVSG